MNKMFLFLIFLIIFNSSIGLCAGKTKSKQKTSTQAIRKEMNSISGLVREMGPFIASEQEFVKDSNKNIIQKTLEELAKSFKSIKTHPVIDFQGLSINRVVMAEQLEQTVSLFKGNKKPMARAKLNAALNLCVSCHSQSPGTINNEATKIFADKDIEKLKLNDFEKAEIYFVTRDFDTAVNLYDKFLNNSSKKDDDEFIFQALEKELIYFVKFKKSFPLAREHFEAFIKEKKFNDHINQELSDWVKALSGKNLWEQFDPTKVKEDEMQKFMSGFIADDEEGPIFSATNSSEVYDLNLSYILLDYYNAHPETKLGARILYWLAVLDKRTNDDLFFSLGDYYLLACMEKYSKDPVAKECYEAYMDDLEINYISKDKDFPKEIKIKVKKLEKLLGIQSEDEKE
jgi:tetratricopeptide (TPR) repeat protein